MGPDRAPSPRAPGLAETDRVRQIYDAEAPRYDWQIALFERVLFGGGRQWVCSRARGDVLELAAGTGRNLAHYPTDNSPRKQEAYKKSLEAFQSYARFLEPKLETVRIPFEGKETVDVALKNIQNAAAAALKGP